MKFFSISKNGQTYYYTRKWRGTDMDNFVALNTISIPLFYELAAVTRFVELLQQEDPDHDYQVITVILESPTFVKEK